MRLGFCLPQVGPIAGPDSVRRVAERAEALGFDSLWVLDRVLFPVAPKAPYPATPDGSLPDAYKRVLDPLGTLTFVAACTSRVRLGSSILNLPFYNPVLLGRELTTLDVLSKGRLSIGFGTGWSPDEYEAVGVDMSKRGERAYEALEVLEKLWTQSTVEHRGKHFHLPKSVFELRPVQKRPPVYMAAYTPATMKRVAEKTDGWNPAGVPIAAMKEMFAGIRGMAAAAGRDPATLELVVRANTVFTPKPLGADRPVFVGSAAQIREDLLATRDAGAHEVFFDVQFSPDASTLEAQLGKLEEIRGMAG